VETLLKGIQIGQLLIQQGVLTEKQAQHILNIQKASYRPFGDLAERLYGISAEAVEDAWVTQYIQEAGVTDLDSLDFDSQCLRTLNRRQAWQFHMLPTHQAGKVLSIATDAEHLVRAINFSSNRLNAATCFLVAERGQLRDFLMRYYPVPEHMAEFAERF
jgi:hypothetical protein